MSLYDDIDINIDLGPIPTPPSSSSASSSEKKEDSKMAALMPTTAMRHKQLKADLLIDPSPVKIAQTTTTTLNTMNLSFLKSQLEAKKALLHNATAAQQQKAAAAAASAQQNAIPPPPGLLDQPPLLQQRGGAANASRGSSTFKLRPHRAVPLPLDSSGAFTIVPKSLKEDKVFLFGELLVEDEYNPTAPTDYASFKQKREQQKLKEKVAKEIAERLARDATEEEEKRQKGAAIAPPMLMYQQKEEVEVEEVPQQQPAQQPKQLANQFGKGVSRGLGVAANIMSRMGYREGQGLGANKQGISRPLEVQRMGRNVGLIVAEERAQQVVTHLGEEAGSEVTTTMARKEWAEVPGGSNEQSMMAPPPTMVLLKSATKIVLLQNMPFPGHQQAHAEFERELRGEMARYGQLVNVLIHQVKSRVFLEFSNQAQAIKALIDLNGRAYAGSQVQAVFYPLDDYNQRRLDEEVVLEMT